MIRQIINEDYVLENALSPVISNAKTKAGQIPNVLVASNYSTITKQGSFFLLESPEELKTLGNEYYFVMPKTTTSIILKSLKLSEVIANNENRETKTEPVIPTAPSAGEAAQSFDERMIKVMMLQLDIEDIGTLASMLANPNSLMNFPINESGCPIIYVRDLIKDDLKLSAPSQFANPYYCMMLRDIGIALNTSFVYRSGSSVPTKPTMSFTKMNPHLNPGWRMEQFMELPCVGTNFQNLKVIDEARKIWGAVGSINPNQAIEADIRNLWTPQTEERFLWKNSDNPILEQQVKATQQSESTTVVMDETKPYNPADELLDFASDMTGGINTGFQPKLTFRLVASIQEASDLQYDVVIDLTGMHRKKESLNHLIRPGGLIMVLSNLMDIEHIRSLYEVEGIFYNTLDKKVESDLLFGSAVLPIVYTKCDKDTKHFSRLMSNHGYVRDLFKAFSIEASVLIIGYLPIDDVVATPFTMVLEKPEMLKFAQEKFDKM